MSSQNRKDDKIEKEEVDEEFVLSFLKEKDSPVPRAIFDDFVKTTEAQLEIQRKHLTSQATYIGKMNELIFEPFTAAFWRNSGDNSPFRPPLFFCRN